VADEACLHELQRSQSGSEREERNAMRAPQKCDVAPAAESAPRALRLRDWINLLVRVNGIFVGVPLFFIVEVEL